MISESNIVRLDLKNIAADEHKALEEELKNCRRCGTIIGAMQGKNLVALRGGSSRQHHKDQERHLRHSTT